MWFAFALGSALFAGLTAVLAKCGIRETGSTVATAIRTVVVLAFSWFMVLVAGSQGALFRIGGRVLLSLVLPGLATGRAGCATTAPCRKGRPAWRCPSTS